MLLYSTKLSPAFPSTIHIVGVSKGSLGLGENVPSLFHKHKLVCGFGRNVVKFALHPGIQGAMDGKEQWFWAKTSA